MSADEESGDTHLAWLALMLGELEERRQDRREAEEEHARRAGSDVQEK